MAQILLKIQFITSIKVPNNLIDIKYKKKRGKYEYFMCVTENKNTSHLLTNTTCLACYFQNKGYNTDD